MDARIETMAKRSMRHATELSVAMHPFLLLNSLQELQERTISYRNKQCRGTSDMSLLWLLLVLASSGCMW